MRIILTVPAARSALWGRPVISNRSPCIWVGCADRFLGASAACQARRVHVTAPPDRTGSQCRTLCQLPHRYKYCVISATFLATRTDGGNNGCKRGSQSLRRASKAMTLSFIWWGLLPLLLIIAIVDLATMSQARRVRMLRRCGMTQAAIADRLQISRYRVRQALA